MTASTHRLHARPRIDRRRHPRVRGYLSRCALVVLATGLPIAGAAPAPHCPDGIADPSPPYGPLDGPPAIAVWRELTELPEGCLTTLEGPASLTVALAGRFTHAGSIEDIARRLGAVSTTIGLPYWSVTEREWKPLVSDAAALGSPDARDERADFAAAEVLSGDILHFAQNDTRSWGMNVYRLRVLDASSDRLIAETDNVSRITLGPVTLFAPHAVSATHFIQRLDGSTWVYFGLSVIRDSAFEAREKSLINRQSALYRFLIGAAPTGEPPPAP